jgi:hypothetical protein
LFVNLVAMTAYNCLVTFLMGLQSS